MAFYFTFAKLLQCTLLQRQYNVFMATRVYDYISSYVICTYFSYISMLFNISREMYLYCT